MVGRPNNCYANHVRYQEGYQLLRAAGTDGLVPRPAPA